MPPPILYIVVPCYNEEEVLPITSQLFADKMNKFVGDGLVSSHSRVLFVNDGSKDGTWDIIKDLSRENEVFEGISLSRNMGHQNALLSGLMHSAKRADVTISIDCDGQDDINAMDEMMHEYTAGCDIVYGVRNSRKTDTRFKRGTARLFYRFMRLLGAETVYDHADYRLMSRRALLALAQFEESNLFLRGLVPLVGFRSSSVYYERHERLAGKSHYPLKKMLALALNGITSLSVKPLKLIAWMGFAFSIVSVIAIIAIVVQHFVGQTVQGWTSTLCIVLFVGGIQLLCLGIIGEYVGKIYSETKRRPRYIVSEQTEEEKGEDK